MYRHSTASWNRRGGALKVLAIIFLVLVLVCGGIGTWIYLNFRSLVVGAVLEPMKAMIAQSNLPQDQKDRMTTQAEELAKDYEEGRISGTQMGLIAQALSEGPFFTLLQLDKVRTEYEKVCKPTEEDLAQAVLTFSRFQRGVVEETIRQGRIDDTMADMLVEDAESKEVRSDLSAEELTAFVAQLKQEADDAGVPVEPYQADFAGLLEDAVNSVLKDRPSRTQPSAETAPAPG